MTTQPWPALDALEAREERQLCGVAAHERLLKERDELRVVLDDLLQERNWAHRIGALQQAERELRLTQADIDFRRATGFVSARTAAIIQRALGLLSEALRGLPAHPAPAPAPVPADAPRAPKHDWCAICGALPTTGCAHLGPPRPAPQEACCYTYVGDLGEIHQPNCTRQAEFWREQQNFDALGPVAVHHFDEPPRARAEAEPEAEVGAGAEARPTTDSTHE